MTIPTTVMLKLATIGLSNEQPETVADMLTAVEAATRGDSEKLIEAAREKARVRWHKWDEKRRSNVDQRLPTVANASQQLMGEGAGVEDKTSNLEIEPLKEEKKERRERAFEAFWTVYPHKIGKADARQKFAAALGKVEVETLMAALHRYVAKTDDRAWCNPATWLHQERWTDQPAVVQPSARGSPQAIKPPSQADVFKLIKENANGRQEYEDRNGAGAVVSYLPAVRSG